MVLPQDSGSSLNRNQLKGLTQVIPKEFGSL